MVQDPQMVRLIRLRRLRLAMLVLAVAALTPPATADEPKITVPAGFHVGVFASGLGGARFMAVDPAGTLLVSIPRESRVVALRDQHGRADTPLTVIDGLDRPHGLAFHQGALYVAETGRVLRFHYDARTKKASQPTVIVPNLPRGGTHWTRTIAFGPDGRLYVSVGSSCNVCREQDPRRAAILRYEANGSGEHLFASGIRNAVGIAFHPTTGALWATINERDWRGDDLPPDYITEVKEGGFYGWPEYMIVRVTFHDGKAAGIEDFATGWLEGTRILGKLVDVIVGSDGALYLTVQDSGTIYRFSYGS